MRRRHPTSASDTPSDTWWGLGGRRRGAILVTPSSYLRLVPSISSFYGIVIWMYFDDHNPPHFHAEYGEHRVRVRIDSLEPLDGGFPARALRLLREWGSFHQDELRRNWTKAQAGEQLDKIEPLP